MVTRILGWILGLFGVLLLALYGIGFAFFGQADLPTWVHGIGAAGALGVALFLFLDWGNLQELGRDQTIARSSLSGVAMALALAVVVVGNIVANRYDRRWDVTASKRYTLAQQSIDIAKALDRKVQVLAFFPSIDPQAENFRELMRNYQRENSLIEAEFHDPYNEAQLAQQLKVSEYGTVILKSGDDEQRIESGFDEEAFTNALVKVTSDVEHVVCGIYGHGEREDMDDQTAGGLGTLITRLQGQNYTWRRINLLEEAPTPEACGVLVLADPQAELIALERDRMAAYVAAGGALVAMIEPLKTAALADDFARYGIVIGDDVVIEGDPMRQVQGGGPTMLLLDSDSFDAHPIAEKVRGVALLSLARSVAKGDDVPGLNVMELARTSDQSWAETTLTGPTPEEPPPPAEPNGADRVGKVPVAVVVEVTDPANLRVSGEPTPAAGSEAPVAVTTAPAETAELPRKAGGKVVVFGDADFASNQFVLTGSNQDLFLNTVAWMVGETDQISIRSNEAGAAKLTLELWGLFVILATSLFFVPGAMVAGAIATWLVRRGR